MNEEHNTIVGRFAPSPTGRMHLGNIYTAVMSWLSVKSAGGRWILRIEDLDPQRSKLQWARLIEDDLTWLGLEWDEGGLDDKGPHGPYSQSRRHEFYNQALSRLIDKGIVYKCHCTRADIMATQAPHQSDGRIIYAGTCRPPHMPCYDIDPAAHGAMRLYVPDRMICFNDRIAGPQQYNLAHDCGDFILQRADGAWSYQLAVVVDDALMGVNEVMRGEDLLLSAAQQIYLYELLGWQPPRYAHLPLIKNEAGVRLSKRDASLSMEAMRHDHTPAQILGRIAGMAGLQPTASPITLPQLLDLTRAN
ncbi:MAG: tRNA glutamyl-Q(34) synthetase GluQRS [Clostridiales bacterium]|nr:tRNA glutamyl-Q(34) synthetase GluQRS [Clostridiales bacterium]